MASLGIELKLNVIHKAGEQAYIQDQYGRRFFLKKVEKKLPVDLDTEREKRRKILARKLEPKGWRVGGEWTKNSCARCTKYRGQIFPKRVVRFPLHPHCPHYWIAVFADVTQIVGEKIDGDKIVANLDDLKLDRETLKRVYGEGRVRLMDEDGLKLSDLYRPGTDELKTLAELGVEKSFGKTGKRILKKTVVRSLTRKRLVAQIRMRIPEFAAKGLTLAQLQEFALRLSTEAA